MGRRGWTEGETTAEEGKQANIIRELRGVIQALQDGMREVEGRLSRVERLSREQGREIYELK